MSNDAISLINDRYGFHLPQIYRTILAKGHFSTSPWENYLELHDCEWLSLDAIAAYEFLDFQITSDGGFVPFAVTTRQDEFCWRLDWAAGSETPIVFCEHGEEGFGYAPHFQGFLYRKVLDEFAGYGPEDARGLARLRHAVALVTPYLPQAWAVRLQGLAQCDFGEWKKGRYGELFLLPKDELEALVCAELAFPHLNERFLQDRDS